MGVLLTKAWCVHSASLGPASGLMRVWRLDMNCVMLVYCLTVENVVNYSCKYVYMIFWENAIMVKSSNCTQSIY